MSASLSSHLQELLARLIETIPVVKAPFPDSENVTPQTVPVVRQSSGDVVARLEAELRKMGIAIFVRRTTFQQNENFHENNFEVETVENTVFNRQGQHGAKVTAEDLSAEIHKALLDYSPDGITGPATNINLVSREGDKKQSFVLSLTFQTFINPQPRI